MTTRQTFGSALRCPWALVRIGCNCPIGRRPATEIVYLTDDEGDHYLGGVVAFYRKRATLKWDAENKRYIETAPGDRVAQWHYRYKRAKRIPRADVLHIFPHVGKSPLFGPTAAEIRRARKALPITTEETAS